MKVLIACEFSGVVRDAFIAAGHDAWSCDLIPSERPGQHIIKDVLHLLSGPVVRVGPNGFDPDCWDLMIAHPPCTHLAVSGARWFKGKKLEQEESLDFVRKLMESSIPRICIENPVSVISSRIRKPDQIIQPWQFGHGETKATCLWLKNLPHLKPTEIVSGRLQRIHRMSPGPNRGKERSRFLPGIAKAMADEWGKL